MHENFVFLDGTFPKTRKGSVKIPADDRFWTSLPAFCGLLSLTRRAGGGPIPRKTWEQRRRLVPMDGRNHTILVVKDAFDLVVDLTTA